MPLIPGFNAKIEHLIQALCQLHQLMELAFEAYERDVISKRKLFELARDANVAEEALELAIGSDKAEPVDVILPV